MARIGLQRECRSSRSGFCGGIADPGRCSAPISQSIVQMIASLKLCRFDLSAPVSDRRRCHFQPSCTFPFSSFLALSMASADLPSSSGDVAASPISGLLASIPADRRAALVRFLGEQSMVRALLEIAHAEPAARGQ